MILSIVITTRNRKKDLISCLDSIKRATTALLDFEIIVVNDESTDGTQDLSSNDFTFSNIKFLHLKENFLMVKSRNIGAKEATGEFVLFIDDDNEIDTKMIETLVSFAKSNPEFGMIGPSMYYFDSKEKYLDYQKINFFTGQTKGYINDERLELCLSDGIPNVFMIPKMVFEKYGYFDESLLQTYTEPDFAFSIRKHGLKCAIVKAAKTYHKVSKSTTFAPRSLGGMYKQKAYCLMRNRTVIVSRYGSFWQKFVYLAVFSWFWPLAYSALILPHKRFDLIKLYWLGFLDGFKYVFSGTLVTPNFKTFNDKKV